MTPIIVIITVLAYFAVLFGVSYWAGRKADNAGFFQGGKQSKWYMVAFAMIWASISGVTYVSVPGMVGASQFGYLQLIMGEKCFYGDGLPQDYAEALSWYRKAADQGDAGAEFCLGWMYENGLGVTRDCAEALKWYRLAADQDYAEAENSLGELYRGGLGTPQDYGEAVRWFYRAARQGNADAENSLGTMYAGGFGVLRDYSEALKWYLRAAAKHHPTARYNLGCLCEHGLGTPRDDAKALSLFRLAAADGDPDAKKKLEFLSRLDEPRQQRMGWAGRLIHAFGLGGK